MLCPQTSVTLGGKALILAPNPRALCLIEKLTGKSFFTTVGNVMLGNFQAQCILLYALTATSRAQQKVDYPKGAEDASWEVPGLFLDDLPGPLSPEFHELLEAASRVLEECNILGDGPARPQ